MFGLYTIRNFIRGLDRKELMKYAYVYVGCFIATVAFLLFRHVNTCNDLVRQINQTNRARKDLQVIMTEYGKVKQQKEQVDALLKKDKSFYLQKYFQELLQTLKITQKPSTSLVSQNLPNGYVEESLQIRFSSLTMQQLCEFLQKLEETPRVYAKKLDISSKGVQSRSIAVSMVIATLKPKEETGNTR